MYTRGTPTWQNPEEGFSSKISAWIPDSVGSSSGFFLNPMGLAGETAHLIGSKLERGKTVDQAFWDFLQSRLSYAAAPLGVVASKQLPGGIPAKKDEILQEALATLAPVPIPAGAAYSAIKEVATGKSAEQYPGQFQRQIMSSVGVRPDLAPSPLQRIYQKATEYNERHHIPRFEGQSDWTELNRALTIGNDTETTDQLRALLKTKTPEQIFRHYENSVDRPFTGAMERADGSGEADFIKSLTKEEKGIYVKAADQRNENFKRAILALYRAHQDGTLAQSYNEKIAELDDESAAAFIQREMDSGFIDQEVLNQMRQLNSIKKK
jgi:hypothetical protein